MTKRAMVKNEGAFDIECLGERLKDLEVILGGLIGMLAVCDAETGGTWQTEGQLNVLRVGIENQIGFMNEALDKLYGFTGIARTN